MSEAKTGLHEAVSSETATTPGHYCPSNATRLVLKLFEQLRIGSLAVTLPDGSAYFFEGVEPGPRADVNVHHDRCVARLLTGGILGFNEAYLDGDWSSTDVAALFECALRNEDAMKEILNGKKWYRLLAGISHVLQPNSKRGAQRNISRHYDLGNAFYQKWLDGTMTYSSALFDESAPDETLEAAQARKYANLARYLKLEPGQRVLEIGCGWGGFAEYAARHHGCHVTGITISREQHDFAKKRMADAGLSGQVDIRFQDYRDVREQYDRIASIEMFEAVGEAYWPKYFDQLRQLLQSGGRAALQIITIEDDRFAHYRRHADYIQKYIFPGGMLPSPSALKSLISSAGLQLEDMTGFGRSYAETLVRWHDRFQSTWPEIKELGFDRRFKRMWEQYLAYCQAGFQVGTIDVVQLAIARD